MSMLRRRLEAVLRRARLERDMDEEMRAHLDMEIEDRIRAGMPPEEARRTALRDFGGVERMKDAARDARGLRPFDELRQDLRFGLRVLGRRPAFALTAVATLAVGIGAPTAVFSMADAVLLRPVPGVHAPEERLFQLEFRSPRGSGQVRGISYPNLLDVWQADMPAVRDLAARVPMELQVAAEAGATGVLAGAAILGEYFAALGVRPSAGRLFTGGETLIGSAEPVVVLSERASRDLFGGTDPVGSVVRVNGNALTVIGVAGDGFRGMRRTGDADLWIPYGISYRVRHADEALAWNRGSSHVHTLLLRLAAGASAEAAAAQLGSVLDGLVEAHPSAAGAFAEYRPTLFADIGTLPRSAERTRKTMLILMSLVGLVLLVACANVANLLIFRGIRRQGESAVRQAIGASRARLLRQHLAESGVLAAGGVLLGLGVAVALSRLFFGLQAGSGPLEGLPLDGRVLAFATFAGAVSLLLAGLVPALVVHRLDLVRFLKDAAPTDTGRKARVRAGLTVVQLALSLALVVGALLAARTLRNVQAVELGFDPAGVVEVRVDPDPQGYDEERASAFQRTLLAEAALLPTTAAVGAAVAGPFGAHLWLDLRPEGSGEEGWPVAAFGDFVSPGYFAALGARVLRGRTFSPEELEASFLQASDAAVVNEALARQAFGTVDVVGRTLLQRGYRSNTTLRIVGVVSDSRMRSDLRDPQEPALYRPLGEHHSNGFTLFVRSSAPPQVVGDGVRRLVRGLDAALPLYYVRSAEERVAQVMAEQRMMARLLTVLAVLATVLAAVGLYGVVAYSVAERAAEIAIRRALGARDLRVVALVVRHSLLLAAVGVAVGLGVARGLVRLLEARLFGIEPLDPGTWTAAAALLLAVALLAAAVPVRYALRTQPVDAMRGER